MAKRKRRTYCVTVYMDGGQSCVFTADNRTKDDENIRFWLNQEPIAIFYLSKIIGYKYIDITDDGEAENDIVD